ncbi:hypothetical protein Gorai_024293 [Gossypium raimondii]|uniref:RNase H type-1 domain-containing protein n=1 Tax=Gossypium raimondii TaxID=29730 RepID=A0A7J8NZH0_GOSRA|nr:hypothetical protein [Gossypium raimondii]
MTNSNAIWVRVIRSKYGVQGGLPESLWNGRYSFLWRSLTKGSSWNIDEIIKVSVSWANQFTFASKSFRIDDDFATAGGFVCDHNGEWIFGFNRYLGMCTVVDAELWGILDGLKLTL